MKRLILLTVLLVVLALSSNAPQTKAQSNQPKCDPAAVIKEAAALTSTGDNLKDMTALLKLRDDISAANVACNGQTFKGTGSKVLDPFVLPQGVYRVTLDFSAKDSIVSLVSIDPKYCVSAGLMGDLTKQETARVDEDCKMTVEVRAYNDPSTWTVTFEPLQ